jgi:hypothetical protein
MVLIPGLLLLMGAVRRQYHKVGKQVATQTPLDLTSLRQPLVVVPIDRWSVLSKRAMTFALTLSPDVVAVHIDSGERTVYLRHQWRDYVENPVLERGMLPPKLVVVDSPYRFVINPIVDFVLDLERKNVDRQIAVIIGELVERRWYYYFLHNQRAAALKTLLYLKGTHRIIVINVPWYLHAG